MDSVASSALETTTRRATDLVLVLVGLKPTLTKQVAFGAMAPAVQPAASRTWKSAGRSPSRTCSCEPVVLLLASAMFVIVSGASPVFLIVIGSTLAAAAVPAATLGNVVGRPSTAGTALAPRPLRLRRMTTMLLSVA